MELPRRPCFCKSLGPLRCIPGFLKGSRPARSVLGVGSRLGCHSGSSWCPAQTILNLREDLRAFGLSLGLALPSSEISKRPNSGYFPWFSQEGSDLCGVNGGARYLAGLWISFPAALGKHSRSSRSKLHPEISSASSRREEEEGRRSLMRPLPAVFSLNPRGFCETVACGKPGASRNIQSSCFKLAERPY